MANDGDSQEKKPMQPEKEIEAVKDSTGTSEDEVVQHPGVDIIGASNTAVHLISNPPSVSTETGWSSMDIPMFGEMPVTASETSSGLTPNPFPNLPPHLQPFLDRLEFERRCMLERGDSPDEALRRHWYNVTAERDHLFRITYCQDSRFDVAEDLDKLEKMSSKVLKEAVCPDTSMGYLRGELKKLLRLIPFARAHLLSENCHHPSMSEYPSQSAELVTDSSEPPDQVVPLEDLTWRERRRRSKPIAVTGSQQSSLSRTGTSSSSGPSASTGAVSKRTRQPQVMLPPTREEFSTPNPFPNSRCIRYQVTSPHMIPCVPINSSEERISSLSNSDKVYGSLTESGQLVFEFADALELGLCEKTEENYMAQSQQQATEADLYPEKPEDRRSPVEFYIREDTSSSSAPSEDPEKEDHHDQVHPAEADQSQQSSEDSESLIGYESSSDFFNSEETSSSAPSEGPRKDDLSDQAGQ